MTEKEYEELIAQLEANSMSTSEVEEFIRRVEREGIDFKHNPDYSEAWASFAMIILAILISIFIWILDWDVIIEQLKSFLR